MVHPFACPDWWARLQDGQTPFADLDLNQEAAAVAVEWFNMLRLPDVAGRPLLRDAAGDWMRDVVAALFGSLDESGARAVGECLLMVPKKNAKTTSAAAIALVFMLMNRRPKADMLIIGPTQKISEVAFEQARGMVEADEYLSKRFQVREHLKTILDRTNGARLMVRTFDNNVLTGCKPILCLIDELHVLGQSAGAVDVLRQVRGGMMPFPESLLVMITTQSDHPPAGVWKSELQYARGVRDGRISDGVRMLPVLYEFPEGLQRDPAQPWRDPALWHLVSPNMGRSITVERLIEGMQRAEHDGKGEVIAWATQHLNVEVGMALHANRWVAADYWGAAVEAGLTLDALLERCDVVSVGIDGGGLDDLLGVAVIGRERGTRRWLHWGKAWAQEIALDRRKDIASKLKDLEAAGDLTICSEPTADIIAVADLVQRLWELGLLPEKAGVGIDPFGVAALIDEIVGRGVPEDALIGIGQGSRLSPAVWGIERKLADGTFGHCGQAIMEWCLGNAVAEQRGNAVIITKETAGRAKIDPLVAMLNAGMIMQRNPEARQAHAPVVMAF